MTLPLSQMATDASRTVAVPANAADVVVKAGPGWVAKIVVTTTGANPIQVYDNASAGSGTIVAALPASPAIGTYVVGMPCVNGITIKGSATNPAVTVSFL